MKRSFASFLLLLLALSSCQLHAQYNTTAFYTKSYKASDGLPDSYILNIFQDSKKYLWIGTYSGLSRFDGTSFTNFGIHNGFSDLYVSQFIEFENHLWIGTRTTIGYLENNRYVPTSVNDGQQIDYVYGFGEVIQDKLWAFTSKGLYEWARNKWVKKILIPGLANIPYRHVLLNHGTFYCCFNDRIVIKKNNGDTTVIRSNSKRYPYFLSITEFDDHLFINTADGLYEFKNEKLVSLFTSQLTNKTIYYYFIDSKKRFWIATEEDGLLVSAPGDEQTLTIKVPLQITLVSRIFEDTEHNIWVANFQGLLKIKNSFFDIPFLPGKIFPDHRFLPALNPNGEFFVYDDKNGLVGFDEKGLHLIKFTHSENYLEKDLHSSLIDAIAIDDKQNFWVATRSRDLFKVDARGTQKKIVPDEHGNTAIDLNTICWDNMNKKLYCGGNKLYIGTNGSFKEFVAQLTGDRIENITRVLALKNGDVLVNSESSGLWILKPNGIAYPQSKKIGLPIDSRLFFTEDNYGKIWVSITGNGLKRYSFANDSTLSQEAEISTMNGLPNDVVETIAVDGQNHLWVATLSGLIVMDTLRGFSGKRFVMYNIGKNQGLSISVHTGLTRLIKDKNGDIWFCNTENIIRFRSKDLKVLSNPPVAHIENVKLNMKETNWRQWSDEVDGYFMLPQNPVLPFNQNTVTFSFKGINFNSDEKVWYSYKLVGVDSNWGPATESNTISFIKLTPGSFTFMMRARNTNSEWGEPAVFSFTIKPPFWKTWWFRSIGILLTSLVLIFLFRMQLKKVNKRADLQNQLRNLEMKALKAQMNPHFIYNALNSIQSLVIDDKKLDALDYMVKFSRLLRQVLNHSEMNTVTLAKELDALKLYIQLESLRLNYSLNYSITLDENIIPEREMIPPMILQPFVENALWHGLSKKEGNKILLITIWGEDNFLRFEIKDNGIGRTSAAAMTKQETYYEGPRGMEITKNRLALYNSTATVDPILINDILNDDNSAGGTVVTVLIKRY